MTLKSFIAEKDGWLYIVNPYDRQETPVIKMFWYPVGRRANGYAHLLNKEVSYTGANGLYIICQGGSGPQFIRLENSGNTKATYIFEIPLKRPRGKDVYWARGAWHKYTKMHGEEWLGIGELVESESRQIFPEKS